MKFYFYGKQCNFYDSDKLKFEYPNFKVNLIIEKERYI